MPMRYIKVCKLLHCKCMNFCYATDYYQIVSNLDHAYCVFIVSLF